jgi:hypothetical protein
MRAVGRDTTIISQCVAYILDSGPLPFYPELLVQVIRDAPISEDGKYLLPESKKAESFLTAQRFRLGEFGLGRTERSCLSRFVALNAFYFYLVLFRSDTPPEEVRTFLGGIRRGLPQAIRLKSARKSIEVKVSKRTIWEAYRDQALRELPAWVQYSAGRGSDKDQSG